MKKMIAWLVMITLLVSMGNVAAFADYGKDAEWSTTWYVIVDNYLDDHGRTITMDQLHQDILALQNSNKETDFDKSETIAALSALERTVRSGSRSSSDPISLQKNTPVQCGSAYDPSYIYIHDNGSITTYFAPDAKQLVFEPGKTYAETVATLVADYEAVKSSNYTPTGTMSDVRYYNLLYVGVDYASMKDSLVNQNLGKAASTVEGTGLLGAGELRFVGRELNDFVNFGITKQGSLSKFNTAVLAHSKTDPNFTDIYVYSDGKTEVRVPASAMASITEGKSGKQADEIVSDFVTTYTQWKTDGIAAGSNSRLTASYWLALYECAEADTALSATEKQALRSNLDQSMQNGLVFTDGLTSAQKQRLNSVRAELQSDSDNPEKYIFSLSGKDAIKYDAQKKEYILTYTTVINGQTVTKVITAPLSSIAGLNENNLNTAEGNAILASFAERYGRVLNLEESTLGFGADVAGTNYKTTAKELVQMYQNGELQLKDLQNDTVRAYLINYYTDKHLDASTKNVIHDMLFAGSDSQVVYLNNDQYLIRGSKNPVSSSEAAAILVNEYLDANAIGKTSLDALNQIWALGLYDDLSDEARAAYNKRMSELVEGNTYKRPDGTTWIRPGSGYSVIPIDIFTNSIISGMSVSKLKAWKTDGTYDNLTDAQKLAVDSRIKAIEAREAEATAAGFVAGVAKVVQAGITGVVNFVQKPIAAIQNALATAAGLLKSYTQKITAAKDKVTNNAEKTFKMDLGHGFQTVTATSYQSALEKVKAIGKSVGEAGVQKEEANFASEARSYVQALADAAAKAAQAAANVQSTTGKVSTSSNKPTTKTNIVATAVAAVAAVVTAVVTGAQLIGSLLSGGGLGSNKLTTK